MLDSISSLGLPFQMRSMAFRLSPLVWHSPVHSHDKVEMAVILNGEGFYRVDDRIISVSRGHILFTPPGVLHELYGGQGEDMEYVTLGFLQTSPEFMSLEQHRGTSSITEAGDLFPELEAQIRMIFRSVSDAAYQENLNVQVDLSSHAEAFRRCCGAAAVFLAEQAFRRKSEPILAGDPMTSDEKLPHRVHDYINTHLEEKVTLAMLGEIFAISPSRLSHLFAEQFGISPIDLMLQSRILKGAHALVVTRESVQDIALDCGFESATSFIRHFKKRMGTTPSEFRRMHSNRIIDLS